jgi:hypothetical protein
MKKILEDIALGHYREIESSGATTIKSAKMLQIFLDKYKTEKYDVTKVKGPLRSIVKGNVCSCCYTQRKFRLVKSYLFRLVRNGQVVPCDDTEPELFKKLGEPSTTLEEKHEILETFLNKREPCLWKFWKPEYLVVKK